MSMYKNVFNVLNEYKVNKKYLSVYRLTCCVEVGINDTLDTWLVVKVDLLR